jgi:hypothetical protein
MTNDHAFIIVAGLFIVHDKIMVIIRTRILT